MIDVKDIAENIIKGDVSSVSALVKTGLDESIEPRELLNKGLLAGMTVVGQKFKVGDIFIPEVLMSAQAMSAGMNVLNPFFIGSAGEVLIKAAIGTVKDDIHDIGKNMVITMLKGFGFEVIDLGIDVPAEKFVEIVKTENIILLGMSAMLTTTAPYMGNVIQALKEANVRDKVKIMVGGAVVTPEFAYGIGADMYALDAIEGAEKAKALLISV